jgi:hypothetical protein
MIGDSIFAARESLPKQTSKLSTKAAPSNRRSFACRVALIGFGTVWPRGSENRENGDGSVWLTHICNRNVERKKQPWVNDVV